MNISLFSNGVVRYVFILMKFTSLACFVVCLMCLSAIAKRLFRPEIPGAAGNA
jgi:hypothetical protein